MKAKNICNYVIVIIVILGLAIVVVDPERITSYQTFLYSIAPLLAGWMAAIWGGNFISMRNEETRYDDYGRIVGKVPKNNRD